MRTLSRLLAALLALVLSGAVHAALFSQESTDLHSEAARARAERKALVLMLELPDCVVCQRMKQSVFPFVAKTFGAEYRAVRLDIERDRPLVDPAGVATTSRELARRYRVVGTPAFLFFDGEGRLAYRHVGGLDTPRQLELLGRFVRTAGYEREPFAEYLTRHAATVAFAPQSPRAASVDFSLRDAEGRARSLRDYRGKLVVLFFGYTRCPDVCPTTLADLRDVLRRLDKDAEHVQVLFVTLDPERDTPEMLARYVPAFDRRFIGLSGSAAQTAAVVERFGLVVERQGGEDGGYTLDHTASLFVFDRDGRLRLEVPHGTPAEVLANELRALLRDRGRTVAATP
jgi:protein SCO1/2